ncbi:MAG: tagaturonate epimerase family protein [Pirellula sp.]
MKSIEKYTFGIGDRFAHQAMSQLKAFELISQNGVDVVPVWNKSNREHNVVGSEPKSVADAAAKAVERLGWKKSWHVDADHIGLPTVDRFIPYCDFYTIDVAEFIDKPPAHNELISFVARHDELIGTLDFPGLSRPIEVTFQDIARTGKKYLLAVQKAAEVYRYVATRKGDDQMIVEVSIDETDSPQTPAELLVILAALSEQHIPIQTIAPKFTGRFNKGVDYVGDLAQFRAEFNDDIAVIAHAVKTYGLPKTLKLSVHSGSDKFSLYPIIREALQTTGAGIHIKTAGTTWLEEIIGLAEAGGDGLTLAKEIYAYALEHIDEFCAPYASVIDIDAKKLPDSSTVNSWTGSQMAQSIRHVQNNPYFNPHMRQLLHVSFKVAAKQGKRFTDLLVANETIVGEQVTKNLYERHLRPVFLGS